MSLADLFNRDIPLQRISRGRQTKRNVQIPDEPDFYQGDISRPRFGNAYAERFVQQENQEYFEGKPSSMSGPKTADMAPLDSEIQNSLSDVDDLTTVGTSPNMEGVCEDLTQVYDNYSFEKPKSDMNLPVMDCRTEIVSRIAAYPVTIIKGSTGCGKTTQVPQFILDSHAENRKHCNIVVTQPRRIAAISVAKRVAKERDWQIGTLIGYQVGLDKVANSDTRILYCTTGVFLQKLIATKHMNDYTHVILDEIHERDEDMDFAMLIVRKFLRTNSPRVKVVLMSATIDTSRFANYFTVKAGVIRSPAVVYDIKRVRSFPVYEYFLDSLEAKCGKLPMESVDNPTISDAAYKACVKLVKAFEHIDELENKQHNISRKHKGSVLIFLPGIKEIETLFDLLEAAKSNEYRFWLCPLHSTITAEEQLKVFELAPPGERKIILSTNLAESSITVPDIKYVVDFCLTRVLVADEETNLTSLRLAWASKNSCIQRAGRAGRVADGRVYRMIHEQFYNDCLEQEAKPEILRSPLEMVVLKTKMLDIGEPKALLALAMDPPDLSSIEKTILKMKELAALLMTSNGIISPHDGDITFIGRVMASLPVDVHITRLFILGHLFGVFDEAVIIGCCMSCKSIFRAPFKERLESYNAKLTWADSSCSDPIACLNAYQVWRREKTMGKFLCSRGTEEAWAKRFYLQLSTLRDIARLEDEVRKRLKAFKIEQIVGQNSVKWKDTEKPLILKLVIAGAFYPNYFSRSGQGGQINEIDAVKMLGGRDPFSTVYLQNLPVHAELYTQTIRQALKPCSDKMKISINGSKAFVEFGQNTLSSIEVNREHKFSSDIPGKVVMPVYRAIKMRQLKMTVEIDALRPSEASKRARELGLKDAEVFNKKPLMDTEQLSLLPKLHSGFMDIIVTHIENAGHFWVQKNDRPEQDRLVFIFDTLNKEGSIRQIQGKVNIGQTYAVAYTDREKKYYRGRVQALFPGGKYQVYFVDYGNTSVVTKEDICELVSDEERLELGNECDAAIECVLSQVQPSLIRDPRGRWTEEANKLFCKHCKDTVLRAKVYSVLNGVASMELYGYDLTGKAKWTSINQMLIEEGFAHPAEETYLSRLDHDMRLKQKTELPTQSVHGMKQELKWTENSDFAAPLPSERHYRTKLRGPFSPLEMRVFGMTRASQGKQIIVEWNSVNSVLLDVEPQDPHERLLVAGTVNQSADGTNLSLRHTTLMPNIHGLASIICLLFAPCVELRTDLKRSRLTGALCGLGVDGFEDPIYAENDMEIVFDTEITLDDLQYINRVRFWMSQRVSPSGYEVDDINITDIVNSQKRIQKSLRMLLFHKSYESQEVINNESRYAWNLIKPEELANPGRFEGSELLENLVFKLHWGVKLNELNGIEDVRNLIKNINQLHIHTSQGTVPKKLTCLMCGVSCDTLPTLRLHLESSQHRILETNIRKRNAHLTTKTY